ncbi:hypothetical protein [Stakelama tenebrarum]|uniref:Polysaccharide biosynthesis protein n=1 Tax=Stakelama tenebrarum TaxID=2711215 RepID=A0A6G6Y3K0_9SPHN|nr:hypothetical protein [Sphingosinithalassobacter tenebrarum]QIG79524.1 hypothetical protein G5C33_06805 [Sphingosinithalassobacter tenebrarum]
MRMMPRLGAGAANLSRYGFAIGGPAGAAAAQFLLSLVLLQQLAPDGFGRYSFLLIASQFTLGIWTALFCAPLPTILTRCEDSQRAMLHGILSLSMAGSLAVAIVFSALALLMGEDGWGAAAYGAFTGLALLRWFARAHSYSISRRQRDVVVSDFVYTAVLLIGVLATAQGVFGLGSAYPFTLFLAAAFCALFPFIRSSLRMQLRSLRQRIPRSYRGVWSEYGRWSILGVVTTELTANGHAYLVATLVDPAAFAPIAASGLLVRPTAVAINALFEYERPRFAIAIAEANLARIGWLRWSSRGIIAAIWVGTGIVAATLLLAAPGFLIPEGYSYSSIVAGAILWMATVAFRIVRLPEAVLLQASGAFRELAVVGMIAAPVTCIGVTIALSIAEPVWSLVGVVAGELLSALLIFRAAGRWHRNQKGGANERSEAGNGGVVGG